MNRLLSIYYLASGPVALLIVLDVAGLFMFGWNWRVLLVVPLTTIMQMALVIALAQKAMGREFSELAMFIGKFYDYRFERASPEEIVSVCRPRLPAQESDTIPFFTRFNNRLRVLTVVEPLGGQPLEQVTAYASSLGVWLFLPFRLSEARGIRRFVLLHELGHSSFAAMAFGGRFGERTLSLEMQIALMLVPFKLRLDPVVWLAFAALALVAYVMVRWYERLMLRDTLIRDEIVADSYAFARCDPSSFGDHPPEVLADNLCGIEDTEPVRLRRRLFVENVSRVRGGQPPVTFRDEDLPGHRQTKVMHALSEILKLGLFAFCAASFAPITNMRLLLVVLVFVAVGVSSLVVNLSANALIRVVDHSLGVREHPELVRFCESFPLPANRRAARFLETVRWLLSRTKQEASLNDSPLEMHGH